MSLKQANIVNKYIFKTNNKSPSSLSLEKIYITNKSRSIKSKIQKDLQIDFFFFFAMLNSALKRIESLHGMNSSSDIQNDPLLMVTEIMTQRMAWMIPKARLNICV